ncbi:hypothetical protein [Denitrobaculum tricleocarpae]|uniref:Outer membrane protein assembly factor BamE n=1 Tax=Denitrobaculum tricleocarpae TaxID=2591009 RepID=A0A545TRW5_9PROT|nr:hypothetical protein [Denitrobaculum tricleocarpae]TQV79881.1 hypothetical protein FKG95_14445 [Denitrobaculum tricleocarpae]
MITMMERGTSARRFAVIMAVIVAAGLLSACAQSRNVPSAGEASAETSGPEAADGKAPVQESAVPKAPALPDVDDNPEQLLTMTRDDLNGLLGQPDLVRRENPAEIWQYRGKNCVLDLFLYNEEDNPDSPFKVVYSEARDLNAQKTDQRSCLGALLRAQLTS